MLMMIFPYIFHHLPTFQHLSGGITTTTSHISHPGCIIQVDEGVLHHDVVLETISHERNGNQNT